MSFDPMAFAQNMGEFAREGADFVFYIGVPIGIYWCFSALTWVVKKGKGGHDEKSWGQIGMRLLMASFVLTLARMFDFVGGTMDSNEVQSAREMMAYAMPAGGGDALTGAIFAAISLWCVMLGMIGFLRGFLLFEKASQGGHDSGDMFWRGLWHVIGGAVVVKVFA